MGITKLSGSRPFWKVNIAMLNDTIIMMLAAKIFVARSKLINFKVDERLIEIWKKDEATATRIYIIIEANQAPIIWFLWFFIALKEESIIPNASFVVAVEPTIAPKPPMMLRRAG